MSMLPLQDRTWVPVAVNDGVCFSKSGGVLIPKPIGLNMIRHTVEPNSKRMDIFRHLGVRSADVDFVRKTILERHDQQI